MVNLCIIIGLYKYPKKVKAVLCRRHTAFIPDSLTLSPKLYTAKIPKPKGLKLPLLPSPEP